MQQFFLPWSIPSQSPDLPTHKFTESKETRPRSRRGRWIFFLVILLLVTIFLPEYPWRHLTATLPYEVTVALATVIMSKVHSQYHQDAAACVDFSTLGEHPLGATNYNPANDPYYITNLDDPVDEFFHQALEDVHFTNIVHIQLESMREDSFPFDEEGLLNKHIKENLTPVEGGTPVNKDTITPFILSLANNTISWHTMWSTIPYTHKAMLSCTSFMKMLMKTGVE